MDLSTHTTSTGFLLPSIHSTPPLFTQQPNSNTQSIVSEQWIKIILGYARHMGIFTIRVEDAEIAGGDWDEILRNPRINRKIDPAHLSYLLSEMVVKNVAAYEPLAQTRSVLLFWRLPGEWAEVLHAWATSTAQLNTILTFYEITDPPVKSPLTGIPLPLLRRAITVLSKTNRAQIIGVADGEGVRFFASTGK